jgi:hypothetical protein
MKIKEILAYAGAGAAAVLTRFAFMLHAKNPAYADPQDARVITMIVFFVVLVLMNRHALAGINDRPPAVVLDKADFAPTKTPQETSDAMARVFASVTDDESRQRAIRDWLSSIVPTTVLIPFVFYIRFGTIGPLGWGLTVFFDVYCLLWAVGLYFRPRTEYHSPVKLRGDWRDRVGAFWLVGCAFGPFFGWLVTEAWPLTTGSWHWRYGLRAFLAAGLPVVLALPLLRYARGKSSMVAFPLLLAITLLPVSTAIGSIQDLFEGPVVRQVQSEPAKRDRRNSASTNRLEFYLKHSERILEGVPE